jgi:hypothetical protein
MTPENGGLGSSPINTTPREHHLNQHGYTYAYPNQVPHLASGTNGPGPYPHPSPAYSNASTTHAGGSVVVPVEPPREGKGLLSWIYRESAPGKTLGKGFVRLFGPGRFGDDDEEEENGEAESDEDEEDGGDGGLEALVRAAERRARRAARTGTSAANNAVEDGGDTTGDAGKKRSFGLELHVLLKSVPVGVVGALDSAEVGATGTSKRSSGANGAVTTTAKMTSVELLSARRASMILPSTEKGTEGGNTGAVGLGKHKHGLDRAASSPAISGNRRISGLPAAAKNAAVGKKVADKIGSSSRAIIDLTAQDQSGSQDMQATGTNPLVISPHRSAVPPSSSGTLIADILRTPRQESKKGQNGGAHDPPPKSSPATHMALARQVLRNPTSHTIDLAQKLVGKDAFALILAEMGVEVGNGEDGVSIGPVASSSKQPAVPAELVKAAAGTGRGKGRTIAANKDKGKAAVAESTASIKALPSSAGLSANKAPFVAPIPAVKPVCKNCGTTETPRWRVKTLADGKERRVCDACGIYFNKTKQMRPKELWSPKAERIPLEDIPKQEAAMAAAKLATNKQMAALGKGTTPSAPNNQSRRAASQQTHDMTAKSANNPSTDQLPRLTEVSFAALPGSPPRQPRVISESVFTTPRRSTRLSQGGSSKHPRGDYEDGAASPKPRRTPRRMAATAAASKVKATFETHAGANSRSHKQSTSFDKQNLHLDHKPDLKPDLNLQADLPNNTEESPGRDRSVTPPPVSEAASRHNESSLWQIQGNDEPLHDHHGSNDLFERFTAMASGAHQTSTSDTDQLDYDLSTWIDMPPLDAEMEVIVPDPDPVVETQDIKFSLDEMNLLLSLTQSQEMMENLDTNHTAASTEHQLPLPDWDPSSPWSMPTPSGGTTTVQKNWLESAMSGELLMAESHSSS